MKCRSSYPLSLIIIASVLTAWLLYPTVASAQRCEKWVAKATSVQGRVEVQKAGERTWDPIKLNDTFCPEDKIRVQDNSRADLALVNQPVLRLDQNTTITLGGVKEERTSLIQLVKGAAHFFSRVRRNLEVTTAFVNAGVEGTEFFVRVDEKQTFISIFQGKVLASNEVGSVTLTDGQAALAEAGKAPVLRTVVRPRDAVQWALYYPPVLYVPPGEAPIKEDTNNPRFLANRASLMLAVGRVDDATKDLERALSLNPNYSDAFALQSIIAVVRSEKEKALNLARKAVETGPNSATAKTAMSYALQASFNLEGARASLQEAVKLEPDNALAWARLAELWSAFGNLDRALEAAQKATALSPNLSRTQTVLGFAYLINVKTKEAKDAFTKAIEFDQSDPLPRLGLGLAKIREGDLNDGGREIEIAASLDPNNSLVRSYLGKTYFERKQTNLDGTEYKVAKELDPKDPTPWFYDAIRKQTINRPVEALHDIEKAIELNDNRAVYRSKLLLDADLAARSASLARIYTDLGFQQRALVEGWRSVNIDPSNFSAHRFLADSYSVLPRHEIARVSELLQSQLLQPTNITPIQPTLAESNLFLISAGGAANLSFNEFNPIFNRDRVALQASGLYGEYDNEGSTRDSKGLEGIVSGIYKKFSFSAGGTSFETDGYRVDNDQDDDIIDLFAQMELTPKTSIQAEYRDRDSKRGFLQMRFEPDDLLPNFRETEETETIRLGFRHAFSPASVLVGNFSHQDKDFLQHDEPGAIFGPLAPIITLSEFKFDDESDGGELQYQLRTKHVKLVSGAGYFDVESNKVETTSTFLPSPPFPPFPFGPGGTTSTTVTRSQLGADHFNAYAYSYISNPEHFTITLGASGDFFDSVSRERPDVDQFNPKFGIVWNPVPNTTLRGAAFRVLKRLLITDQTLEPTQVAGFNQFFDDANGTESWRYGAAVDQKFTKDIYGGAEFSKRDLTVPYLRTGSTPGELDWKEKMARAYLYWTPHSWFSLSGEYLYEKFDRDQKFGDGALYVKTHYVPLGINFFHPSGLSATFKETYVDQKGSFERKGNEGTFTPGEDNFWVADASIGYRLPKRYGVITVGGSNLFDQEFKYFDTDRDNPRIQPDRFYFAKITLAIP